MAATLAAGTDERKHTFDSGLDFEHVFVHDRPMHRTYVRRRRTAAAGILLALALLVGSPVARAFGGSAGADEPAATYVVRAGDTLWSIAERHAPARDPRAVIHEVIEVNDLGAAPIVPGQTLTLPDGG